jgi:hypothetical protein
MGLRRHCFPLVTTFYPHIIKLHPGFYHLALFSGKRVIDKSHYGRIGVQIDNGIFQADRIDDNIISGPEVFVDLHFLQNFPFIQYSTLGDTDKSGIYY